MSGLPELALSIRQPWAWAIVHAGKDVENRGWSTQFRGPVCIHASKRMTRDEYSTASRFITRTLGGASDDWIMRWLGVCAAPERLEYGGIIGIANISDCVTKSDSPWFFGRHGFVLVNARPVDFIPVRGALGFFNWRDSHEQ